MRTAHRLDVGHAELSQAFERLGWTVVDLSGAGNGVPDVLIGHRRHGAFLIEFKSTNGRLRQSQIDFIEDWPRQIYIVRSVDDVVDVHNQLTRGRK